MCGSRQKLPFISAVLQLHLLWKTQHPVSALAPACLLRLTLVNALRSRFVATPPCCMAVAHRYGAVYRSRHKALLSASGTPSPVAPGKQGKTGEWQMQSQSARARQAWIVVTRARRVSGLAGATWVDTERKAGGRLVQSMGTQHDCAGLSSRARKVSGRCNARGQPAPLLADALCTPASPSTHMTFVPPFLSLLPKSLAYPLP